MEDFDPPKSKARTIGIIFLILLLLGAIGLYVSGVSLKSMIYGITGETGEKVGVVKAVTGQLKRQPKDSLEFKEAALNGDLYNEDTVMTGPEDHATLELFDGSTLELEPGSLIRLTFDTATGVGGIQRRVLIDIVAGNVKSDPERKQIVVRRGGRPVVESPKPVAPSPSPSPEVSPTPSPEPSPSPSVEVPPPLSPRQIRITEPKPGQVISIPQGKTPPLKQPLIFQGPKEGGTEVMMVLKNSLGQEVLKRTVIADKTGRGGILATFEKPGAYQIELKNPDGTPIGKGVRMPFRISSDYEAIETESPLVGGEPIDSNRYTGKRLTVFDVVLRWKPLPNIDDYRVLVRNRRGQALVNQVVQGSTYSFPKAKIYSEPLLYVIRAENPTGYTATSKTETFIFNFNSPLLTLPADNGTVSLKDPAVGKKGGVIFTWQRTTFTQGYEYEISLNDQFEPALKKVPVKENFLVFRGLRPGDYWWRVRSVNGDIKSPPGHAFKITVTP